MFTLPQGPNASDKGTVETGKPIVEVTEPAAVWEQLMRGCYAATAFAPPEGIDYIWPLIEAARKYQMDGVRSVVSQALLSADALENHTMRVYTLACAYELEDVARMAAKYTLRHPLHSITYVPEMRCATAGAHQCLLEYHRECGRVARTFIMDNKCLTKDWVGELRDYVFLNLRTLSGHVLMDRALLAVFSIMAPAIQETGSCTTCSQHSNHRVWENTITGAQNYVWIQCTRGDSQITLWHWTVRTPIDMMNPMIIEGLEGAIKPARYDTIPVDFTIQRHGCCNKTRKPYYKNEDLRPVPIERRKWKANNFWSFWVATSFNVNT
ncbi:predicted protein [Postia placenta Mad-698-R]|uniref:Uncharacterized protein n=1 Tax=Postia placenta MAD-698-R-SB12 TaxID=670580 RepID=A0A1X6MPT6_9APHY|nr:hypothetical protein POSPLADRAFT_1154307 [Postia placenta MAD-698-R-SB12]EED78282.1 predicted protein [Postia placenta Mad-698-R]OSX58143.1 hypothetical protein POSPLADRAFT_1154307 [Postia placenta MAD-698-R-SB12]